MQSAAVASGWSNRALLDSDRQESEYVSAEYCIDILGYHEGGSIIHHKLYYCANVRRGNPATQ